MERLLIVIDMQNDFITGSLGTKEAREIVDLVCKKIREFQGPVYYTMDTHNNSYLSTMEGKNLPIEHCIKVSKGWALQEDIMSEIQKTEHKMYEKNTFGSVKLAEDIKSLYEQGLRSVELCGVCTDICVISNALVIKAFVPELEIIVDSSCCAGVTKESHENALNAMKMCHIQVK